MQKDVLEAARELLPLITRHRGETESARRIAQPVVESLRKSRLCRLAIPRELHGLELPTPAALGVYELLAGAEASVGWIVWNNTLPCFWGRFLEPSGARGNLRQSRLALREFDTAERQGGRRR